MTELNATLSGSDRDDLAYAFNQLRCVFDELHDQPEGLLPPQLRSHYYRAYSSIDAQFTEVLTHLSNAAPHDHGYGLTGELLRAKTDLLVASIEEYRDVRASIGLPIRRQPRQDLADPNLTPVDYTTPERPHPVKPAKLKAVRRWLSHVMGVASPVLGSVAEAFPPIKAATEGLSEICEYVGGSCDLLGLVEDTYS